MTAAIKSQPVPVEPDKVLALARDAGYSTQIDVRNGLHTENIWGGELETAKVMRFAALIRREMEADGWRQCAVGQGTTQFCGMVEELRKDAERLDWIDTLSSSGLDHIAYGDYRYYVHGKGYRKVREVVDEAMSKERK